jgi:hypothetical protein
VTAPEGPPPLRTLAPGSTKGTIACGEKRCAAGKEVCTFVDRTRVWACVPPGSPRDGMSNLYECDDGSDCAAGKTCCRSFASAEESFFCVDRKDPSCNGEVCVSGGDGAECPKGRSCKDDECLVTSIPGATCQGGARCPADKPVCKWEKGKGQCVSSKEAGELSSLTSAGPEEGGISLLMCTKTADCGAGNHCCTGFGAGPRQAFCAYHCDTINTMQYCDSSAECPEIMGAKTTCRAIDGFEWALPKWAKACQAKAE